MARQTLFFALAYTVLGGACSTTAWTYDGDAVERRTESDPGQQVMVLSRYFPASGTVSLVPMRRDNSQLVRDGAFAMDPIDRTASDAEPVFAGYFEGFGYFSRALVVRTGRLRWTPEAADGREASDFAIEHSSGHLISTMNVGFAGCWFERVNLLGATSDEAVNRCRHWGLNETSDSTLSAPIRLWRPRVAPAGATATLANTFRRNPFVLAPAVSDASPAAFTHGILGDLADSVPWQGAANVTPNPDTAMLRELPASRLGEAIEHLSPLGKPAGGVTKPHIFLYPTVTGLLGKNDWNEAIGYDCPRVLFDADADVVRARRLHSPLAVSRCIALRTTCGSNPTCQDADGGTITNAPAPGLSQVRADSAWVMRNRVYVGAPADMQLIEALMNGYPEPFQTGDPRRRQWKVTFRFGAGQLMHFDHLAHVTFTDVNTIRPGTGPNIDMEGVSRSVPNLVPTDDWRSNPIVDEQARFTLPAGRVIGFVYRIPPWRRAINGDFRVTGRPFDWGAFDRLAPPNRMTNLARYRREDGARQPFMEFFNADQWTAARTPYGFYARTNAATPLDLNRAFDNLRGNDLSGPSPSTTVASMQPWDGFSFGLRDVRGTLAGQWFRRDPANPASPGQPALAVASESATPGAIVVIEYQDPITQTSVKLSTCPATGTPQREGMIGRTCMNMGMSGFTAPENAALTGTNSFCYEAAPDAQNRFYLRFEALQLDNQPFAGVRVFRRSNLATGQGCPTSGAGAGEDLVAEYIR